MAYYDSNAAYAYDFEAMPAPAARPETGAAPAERPRFDVYTGEGREANQVVSPVFTHVVKVFCVLVALFFAIGIARVAIAGVTASVLNTNAALNSSLETAQDESSNLEVMNSVYGADTRIRDLATGTLAQAGATDDQGAGAAATDAADAGSSGALSADTAQ